jgi:hypothetical protein
MQSRSILGTGTALVLALPFALAMDGHHHQPLFRGVAAASPKTTGRSAPNVLTPELVEAPVAQGDTPLENPNANFSNYGYDADGPMLPAPGDVQAPGHNVEASKTEPDKNVYLVLQNQHGPDAGYDYGRHFLFQGHETGVAGYVTRINLDADEAHRVTLFATQDSQGHALPNFDGITWDPWAGRLLTTAEGSLGGGVWQTTLTYPSTTNSLTGIIGQGGFEGIQNDGLGNLFIVEDSGGPHGTVNTHARQPNSFIFRFLPTNRFDLLQGGVLQALQVMSIAHPGQPIVFHAGQADADILSQDVRDLHTYGNVFTTHWVTVHDTAVDGTAPFDANAAAKAALGTPFKRPENGVFRPGTQFGEFFFDETGDTDANTEAGSQYGGFGSAMRWVRTSSTDGRLIPFFIGDLEHNSFDNVAFFDATHVVYVEDRGDGLHSQDNALDSAWMFDVTDDYGNPSTPAPIRILAQGRDASATIDSGLGSVGGNGFQNEGDNEITGIHVSNGDPTILGVLGGRVPQLFQDGWRAFYTQQHGDNVTWEILPAGNGGSK